MKKLILDDLITIFNRNSIEFTHLLNCRIDGIWINFTNSIIMGKRYDYDQSYTLVIDRDEIYINNWELLGTEKFNKFQDKYTYKNIKSAIKAFIKLSTVKG